MGLHELHNINVAVLVSDGVGEHELAEMHTTLVTTGARMTLVSADNRDVVDCKLEGEALEGQATNESVPVTCTLASIDGQNFDALVVLSAPRGDLDDTAALVESFLREGRPVAIYRTALPTLAERISLADRRISAAAQDEATLTRSGATVVREPAVVDRGLVTGNDLAYFLAAMIEAFGGERHSVVEQRLEIH